MIDVVLDVNGYDGRYRPVKDDEDLGEAVAVAVPDELWQAYDTARREYARTATELHRYVVAQRMAAEGPVRWTL